MTDLSGQLKSELQRLEKKYRLKWDKIAVGVSGGADSLALVLLLDEVFKNSGCRLSAITVNHHLRPEADAEAAYVARLLAGYGIEHHILDWHHEEIVSGVEEKARTARYALIREWCRKQGIVNLMTAHHRKDQAETFMIRLQRGSGADGLASIAPVSQRDGMNLIRPLLNFAPEALREYLTNRKISWMEDGSNDCDDFLRVKIRKMLPRLEQEIGLSEARIAGTAKALNDVKEYFDGLCRDFIAENMKKWENVAYSVRPDKLNSLHLEVRKRVWAILLKEIGGSGYAPSYDELVRLCRVAADSQFKGCTLGGCEITIYQKRIWIIPEMKGIQNVSHSQWADYVSSHPGYAYANVPYKLKKILFTRNQYKNSVVF